MIPAFYFFIVENLKIFIKIKNKNQLLVVLELF